MLSVSIVVPTYNRAEQLARLLTSFDNMVIMPEEIIIIDDCSKDSTPQVIDKWIKKPHLFKAINVRMDTNSGPAKARNTGINRSYGDVIAFTDSDCIVHPHWIEWLSKNISTNPELVGIGGSVRPVNNDPFSRYYTFYRILEPPAGLQYLVSANCIYRRDALFEAGGFNENISIPGGGDVGLSFKLSDLGYNFGFEEKAIVYHEYRASVIDFIKTFYNYGYGCRLATHPYEA